MHHEDPPVAAHDSPQAQAAAPPLPVAPPTAPLVAGGPPPPATRPLKDSPWIVATTTMLAILSFALNMYLLYDKLAQRTIEQPPPAVSRIQMSVRKSTILDALASKQTMLSAFPNLGMVETPAWQALKAATLGPPTLAKEATKCIFFVLQNNTKLPLQGVRIMSGAVLIATIPSLPPEHTRFVLLDTQTERAQIDVQYQIVGAQAMQTTRLPAPTGRWNVLFLLDYDFSQLNSLDGLDDRVRMLMGATH